MNSFFLKYFFLSLLAILSGNIFLWAQEPNDSIHVNIEIGEVRVFEEYPFKNQKEELKYREMESDLRLVYPLIVIIRKEYERVNKELSLYQGDKEKEFLKWYENYARGNYMHYLSGLESRQGRLFLKLISRELNNTPYDLIKKYRNGFRAVMWQGVAMVFFTNLKANYDARKEPMIEHIMQKLDAEHLD